MLKRLASRDGNYCKDCRYEGELTIDHRLALCLGGTSRFENLQLLCYPCQKKKARRETDEFNKLNGITRNNKKRGTWLRNQKRTDGL